MSRFAIAIDGPAGAGKSTVGERLATLLDAIYFDSGVLYRAVTLAALQEGVAQDDAERLASIAESIDIDVLRPTQEDGRQSDILVDGVDVTWAIRTPEVDRAVSEVSAHRGVRAALLGVQRRIGRSGRVVMVGRDIGTVVMPDADAKFFLHASLEERAHRRCVQLAEAGRPADFDEILIDMRRRDQIDTQRAESPLMPANDAVIVNTDGLSIDEVVQLIHGMVMSRLSSVGVQVVR
jgi:cytidylate kinase